jgi:predicted nucleic acid-binding protein
MKDKFPGHFSTTSSKEQIWENCIFVFDTNILLNLYRYSDETRTLFTKTLEGLRDRIWIPHRVAAEYLENRLDVIYEQQEEYEKAITEINKLKGKLENTRQHPFISADTMRIVGESLNNAISELNKNKETHSNRINSDEIKDIISEIFDGRVGDKPSNETLETIISEGTDRYKQKIPPGYSDIKKQSAEDSLTARCRPYGDLIIWKSLLDKAKQANSPVIFVTDDGKEDWWLRFKGKTLGPRPELIEEFSKEIGQEFYMYLPERFLSLASEKAQEKPSKEVLDEIRDIRIKEQDNSSPHPSLPEPRNPKRIKFFSAPYRSTKTYKVPDPNETSKVSSWEQESISTIERTLMTVEARISQLVGQAEHLRQMMADYPHQNPEATNESDDYLSMEAEYVEHVEKIDFYQSMQEDLRDKLRALYIKRRDDPF